MRFRIYASPSFACLLMLIVTISPHRGYGQKQLTPPILAYNHTLTSENGLSENNVSAIIKDKDGFMWMGTGNGLDRFYGYSFVHYIHTDNDSTSLSNNTIRNLLIDSKGRLWVGTYNGLNLFDSRTETFQQFLIDHSNHTMEINSIPHERTSITIKIPDAG